MKNDFSEIQQSIEKLDQEIQERKKEYVSLKVLLYAGILLLLVGGLYSNSTLQKVQLESLEKSFSSFQSKLNQDIGNIEVALFNSLKQQGKELEKLITKRQKSRELVNTRAQFEKLKKSFLKVEKDLDKLKNIDPQTKITISNYRKQTASILNFYSQSLQPLIKTEPTSSPSKK
jgi:phage terminase small subunit